MSNPVPTYLFLALEDHGATARELTSYGGSRGAYVRCLNILGRWAVHGSPHAPLLVWEESRRDDAQVAAERASRRRVRPVVVFARADSAWAVGRDLALFVPEYDALIERGIVNSAAKSARLAAQTVRLAAYAEALFSVYFQGPQDGPSIAAASDLAGRRLRAAFGSGVTVTSAMQWLAGRKGLETLESVFEGEADMSCALSLAQVATVAAFAATTLGWDGDQPTPRVQ